jgi:cytochrome c oxidase assembly protein subunit 15
MIAQGPAYDGHVPKLLEVMRNPLAAVAQHWTPSPRTVHRAALTALVMSVVIVVTGGAVRLTGSGLGCPTWPSCTADSIATTPEMGIYGVIEFGNRLLTYVVIAAIVWAVAAARAAKPWRRSLTRLGWAQFWVTMGNAVLGGITVLMGLNPYTVAGHFLLSIALITVAVVTLQRSGEGDGAPRPVVGRAVTQLAWLLTAASAGLVTVGTLVTGAGPHAGDSSDVPRVPVDWTLMAQLHADFAWVVGGLAVALWFVLRAVDAPAGSRARARDLLLVLVAQGVIGYIQYFGELPAVLVAFHMLGSALVWIAVLRVMLSLRERPREPRSPGPSEQGSPVPAAA